MKQRSYILVPVMVEVEEWDDGLVVNSIHSPTEYEAQEALNIQNNKLGEMFSATFAECMFKLRDLFRK